MTDRRERDQGRGAVRNQGADRGHDVPRRHGNAEWRDEAGFDARRNRSDDYYHGAGQDGERRFRYNDYEYGRQREAGYVFDHWIEGRDQAGAGRPGPHSGRGPKGYQRSDERIREEVCEQLTQDGAVDASEVEVEVQAGEVTLRGTVASRAEKRRAADLSEQIAGVRDVHNQLRLDRSDSR